LGTQFDPELFPLLTEILKDEASTYSPAAHFLENDIVSTVEIVSSPTDLIPGMVVSRDVRSGTGVLLLSNGTVLDERKIAVLRRNLDIDPSKEGISVYIKRKQAR
jgi:hypothetical protein